MTCPHLPELSYATFSRGLIAASHDGRLPLCGTIELTERCNLDCLTCYIRKPLNDRTARKTELELRQWIDLLDQIADEGCLSLLFTGGEPLARGDFIDIYTHAKKRGFIVTLFTNGTLLNPKLVGDLAEWPPRTIEITMYGRSQTVYERVTRVPGSYERFMRGIELLLERGIPFDLKTIVITANRHELGEMKSFAKDLGVRFRFDPLMNPKLDGCQSPLDYRLSPKEVLEIDRQDDDLWNEMKQFAEQSVGKPKDPESLYYCAAGVNSFHLSASGRLSACLLSREPWYDTRFGSFRDGWKDFLPSEFAKKREKSTPCQTCELVCLCFQCPGWAGIERNHSEDPIDYLCSVTHLRADALGIEYARKEGPCNDSREE